MTSIHKQPAGAAGADASALPALPASFFLGRPARAALDHAIEQELFALFSFAPPAMATTTVRPKMDLAVVLDTSSSMGGDPIEYAKRSLLKLVQHMGVEDRLSIVTFSDLVDVPLTPRLMTPENKREAEKQIRRITPHGMTNLSGGVMKGLELLGPTNDASGRMARVLLFTDGQANVGVSNTDQLFALVTEHRAGRGLATFGYGAGFNEALLTKLAVGGGHYYIDTPDKILVAFGAELGALVSTYAQNVELTLETKEDVELLEVLNDTTVEEVGASGTTDASGIKKVTTTYKVAVEDLLAEQPFHVAVRLRVKARANVFPRDTTLATGLARFLDCATRKYQEVGAKVAVRFVKAAEADAKDDTAVMEEVGIHRVVQAQARAIHLANAGNYAAAGAVMVACSASLSNASPVAASMASSYAPEVSEHALYTSGGGSKRMSAGMSTLRSRKGMSMGATGQSVNSYNPVQSSYVNAFVGGVPVPDSVPDPVFHPNSFAPWGQTPSGLPLPSPPSLTGTSVLVQGAGQVLPPAAAPQATGALPQLTVTPPPPPSVSAPAPAPAPAPSSPVKTRSRSK